jgi:2-oxoglutarate ferredoxin oxidoreductase subunit gamma
VDARQVGLGMYDTVVTEIGNSIVFNICMLGALIGLTHLLRSESIAKIVETRVPPDFLDMNRRALQAGLDLAAEIVGA